MLSENTSFFLLERESSAETSDEWSRNEQRSTSLNGRDKRKEDQKVKTIETPVETKIKRIQSKCCQCQEEAREKNLEKRKPIPTKDRKKSVRERSVKETNQEMTNNTEVMTKREK